MRPLLLGPYTLRTARRATVVALFFQWFIVVTGATVRLTGSGLGCPNWPTCTTTRATPELAFHPMVEFLNRMTATPTLLAALVAAWTCWRLARPVGTPPRRDLRIATALTVFGVLVQAGVGALTVILELPPEIVAVHFLVSVGLIASATIAVHAASSERPLRRARHAALRTGAGVLMLASLLAVIVAGVLTTASGPHSGAAGTGQHVDRFGIFDLAVTLHARGAYAFLVLVVLLTWLRARRGVALRELGVLVTLVVIQVTLGELQYRNGLPWGIVLAHVANAALLWLVAVRIAADAVLPHEANATPEPSHDAHRHEYDPVSAPA
ncbi:MAG: heme synthase [Thermoleophilia bacterium]|nr:heme synthase [Thermoleophilia bacterium]